MDQSVAIATGHNVPPADQDPLAELLSERYAHLEERAKELLAAEARLPDSLTEETVGRVTDFAAQIKACVSAAEQAHKSEKAEYLAKCRVCDAWLSGIKQPLVELCRRVEARVTAYLNAKEREERRRREEEAKRLAEEARARAAAGDKDLARQIRAEAKELRDEAKHGRAADLVRTHTGMGKVATLRTQWVGEIVDRDALDLEKLRPHIPLDALEKALRAFIKAGGRELAGARIYQEKKATIR